MPNLQPPDLIHDAHEPLKSISSILVVGGCGFLGHHIVHQIRWRHPKAQVHALDLRCTQNRFDGDKSIHYHEGDITDAGAMAELFGKVRPEVVVHTASTHFVTGKGKSGEALMWKVNVEGTRVLLEEAKKVGVKAFVYTSSASVVMRRSDGFKGLHNIDERWPVASKEEQYEYYMYTKAAAEQEVLDANRSVAGFLTATIRPAMIYGEGDVQAVPLMMQAARRGQWRFQLGDNTNLFDATYAGNASFGHLLAAEALLYTNSLSSTAPLDLERVDGEAFFITNGAPVPFWDFPRLAWKLGGTPLDMAKVWTIPEGPGLALGGLIESVMWLIGKSPNLTREKVRFSCMTRYYSVEKAKERLGYKPVVSFEESLRRAVRDIDERGVGGLPATKPTPSSNEIAAKS